MPATAIHTFGRNDLSAEDDEENRLRFLFFARFKHVEQNNKSDPPKVPSWSMTEIWVAVGRSRIWEFGLKGNLTEQSGQHSASILQP